MFGRYEEDGLKHGYVQTSAFVIKNSIIGWRIFLVFCGGLFLVAPLVLIPPRSFLLEPPVSGLCSLYVVGHQGTLWLT